VKTDIKRRRRGTFLKEKSKDGGTSQRRDFKEEEFAHHPQFLRLDDGRKKRISWRAFEREVAVSLGANIRVKPNLKKD